MTRMKTALLAGATSIALALTFNSPAMAGTEVIKGLSCLTGKLDMLATTKKDLGWAWSSNFTWYAKDNPKRNVAGKCVGSGGLTGGKYETAPFRCKVLTADGSTYMTKGTATRVGHNRAYRWHILLDGQNGCSRHYQDRYGLGL